MSDAPWWKAAVCYQVYPRSFADSDGDGIGDLEGLRSRLDHLEWLGVDAVWLSPIYPSPMADFGYDVSDYCDIDPVFGSLADLDRLVEDLHNRDMRLILDWVPNHTSNQHPWFVEARSSRDDPKRDWYVWHDGSPDQEPNNWLAAFGGRAWTWDDKTEQWYLHLFLAEQPDLNWRNPEVVAAMHDTLRFWLDRGVDGFRIDVIHGLVKPSDFPDTPPELLPMPHAALNDEPETHEIIRGLRTLLDSYSADRMMVGEVFLLSNQKVATYYGDGDELHLAFNFTPLFARWDAGKWRRMVAKIEALLGSRDAWPTWVLSNHDNSRHRSRLGGSEARARAAAVLLLTMRGTPFLYAGEELGLLDLAVPPERQVDPGGRDRCRGPIPWDATPSHGWVADPWLPMTPDADVTNAETLRAEEGSILHLYRHLLAARRASPALRAGSIELLDNEEDVLAYRRFADADVRAVAVNFANEPRRADIEGAWVVELSSSGRSDSKPFHGELPPDEAVILRPARPQPP
jgi:alpha-glucosidase